MRREKGREGKGKEKMKKGREG